MTTFAESGKEINDLFIRNFPVVKTLEVNFLPNPEHLGVTLTGIFKGEAYEGYLIPTFRYRPWGVDLRTEISSPDKTDKTLRADLTVVDILTPGLKGEFGFTNGKRGEMSVGGVYRNQKFGGITTRIGFPLGSPKYLAASLQIENEDTNGFGVGGSVKVSAGDEFTISDWKALISVKKTGINGYIGVEQKLDDEVKVVKEGNGQEKVALIPSSDLLVVGGLMKKYELNKIFAINGNYNTTRDATKLEVLFEKRFIDGSFWKIKAGVDGNVSTSREIVVPNGSIILGANANLTTKTGALNFNVTTNF